MEENNQNNKSNMANEVAQKAVVNSTTDKNVKIKEYKETIFTPMKRNSSEGLLVSVEEDQYSVMQKLTLLFKNSKNNIFSYLNGIINDHFNRKRDTTLQGVYDEFYKPLF